MVYGNIYNGMRLGNVLAIVATASSLAYRNNDDFVCIASEERIAYLSQFKDSILRDVKFISETPENIVPHQEKSGGKLTYKNNICIYGYYLGEFLYDHDVVCKLIGPSEQKKAELRQRFPMLNHPHSCGISVRRGDYLKLPAYHPICSIKYFRDAMAMMPEDSVYVVCSDDIEWCKKTFVGDKFCFIENASIEDQLYVHTLCANNIISNSSFSWWGAWLNDNPDKKVIMPRLWSGILNNPRKDNSYMLFRGAEFIDNKPSFGVRVAARKQCVDIFVKRWSGKIKRFPKKIKKLFAGKK